MALLCGWRSLYAIAQWGREQPEAVVRTLGFARGRAPQGLAALRNAVVGLLHQYRLPNLAASLRAKRLERISRHLTSARAQSLNDPEHSTDSLTQ